ncbi:MAG TPA: CheR family methyltransferase [Candidatus Wunengus sp. YC60]|uniref:CheR family methyltransferase n=1 Tax=Candidatus Wunengus sp. YC60 TaxID=3367697 RepID=UPI004028CED9
MTNAISKQLLSQLSELITPLMGLHFPETRWGDLERGIIPAAREFGFTDIEAFIKWLRSAPLTKNHVEVLASYLTVGETYFFREKESFQVIEDHILPELIRSGREGEKRLRIWSAGCSTGEEPYSIAILLSRMISDLKDWNITLVATDINLRSLKKASEGQYSEWSFRNAPSWIKESYFKRIENGHYEIIPAIRKMVTFQYLNLAEDVYPSLLNNTNAMDVIFCRNVLMYFSPEQAKKVVHGFHNSLLNDGWLLVSPTEAFKHITDYFTTANFSGTTLYRKSGKKSSIIEKGCLPEIPSYMPSEESKMGAYQPLAFIPEPSTPAVSLAYLPARKVEKQKEPQPDPYREASLLFKYGFYAEAMEKLIGTSSDGQGKNLALLARTCANQGNLDDAQKWCEKAIAADKLNPGYYHLLATILQECGRIENAVTALKKALYLDHNFVLAYFALGNLMQRQGESEMSRKYLKNALELVSLYKPEEVLPESEGITAGRLSEILEAMIH